MWAGGKLFPYVVPPKTGNHVDEQVAICGICNEQLEKPEMIDITHWRCIHDCMWSTVPITLEKSQSCQLIRFIFAKNRKEVLKVNKNILKELLTDAYAERVNLKIQEILGIAKRYRNILNYKMMTYFHLGDLKIISH